jgi:ABC-2 type transport system permease protein
MAISARPMTLVTPKRSGSGAEYFMSSSSHGVKYVDEDNMEEGTFYIGIVATEGFEEGPSSRFTVISCPYFIDDSLLSSFSSISNSTVFMNAINANFDDVTVFSIPTRSLTPQYNTFTNTAMWSIFFIGIVPVVFIAGGLVFWSKRRKQ